MKNLKVLTILTVFLIALSSVSLMAQRKNPGRSSGARAAYGFPEAQYKATKQKKKKKFKQRKARKNKNKPSQPAYRKKNPWVN